MADIQLVYQQQDSCIEDSNEPVIIEDDADEVLLVDEPDNDNNNEEDDDDVTFNSGMRLVTEKLINVKVLPSLSKFGCLSLSLRHSLPFVILDLSDSCG